MRRGSSHFSQKSNHFWDSIWDILDLFDLFANSNRRQYFIHCKMHILKVLAFTKKKKKDLYRHILAYTVENEAACNWVMVHDTLKNYSTSG